MTENRPWIVQHYDSLPTTMERADMLAACGAPERTIVTADRQTAGRGRGGRTWHNEPGTALQATAILRPRGVKKKTGRGERAPRPAVNTIRASDQVLVMSTSLVSGRNRKPTTRLIAAITTGYHRPE